MAKDKLYCVVEVVGEYFTSIEEAKIFMDKIHKSKPMNKFDIIECKCDI